jgi:hypothetical protein
MRRCTIGWLGVLWAGCAGGTSEPEDTDPPVIEACSPLQEAEPVARYDVLAADFGWTELDGTEVRLSDVWSSCESLVAVFWAPSGYHEQVWEDAAYKRLLTDSPPDVHYLFGTHDTDRKDRRDRLKAMRDALLEAAERTDEGADAWADRLHFADLPIADLGWPGELGAANPRRTEAYHAGFRNVGFSVDRFQRVRALGELLDWSDSTIRLEYLAHEAQYFEFEANRQQSLDAEQALEVVIWEAASSGTGWDGPGIFTEVAIPDLSAYDTLALDLEMGCPHTEEGETAGDRNCPEWDRLTHLYLCEREDPEICTTEVGRWVTPYTQSGRWVHDVTPLLAALGDGGETRRFRYKAIDDHTITLKLRLTAASPDGARPTMLVPLFTGGGLHRDTNDRYAPIDVPVPATARRVELAAVISGHSFQKEPANCAEFCDHQHLFSLGGQTEVKAHPEAGEAYGCLERVGEGVVPNQFGSWPFGRGGWCPGEQVSMWRADVTSLVIPGETTQVAYQVLVDGAPFNPRWYDPAWDFQGSAQWWEGEEAHPPGIWVPEVVMNSWLVIYE